MKILRLKDLPFLPASHEDPRAPGVWKKILLEKREFVPGNLQMVNFAKMPVGSSFRPHYHEDMDEYFLLLKGIARVRVENEVAQVEGEEMVLLPRGRVHQMENIGPVDIDYIVIGISYGIGGKTVMIS
jgi:mannose-6-phosphate isomerase-like protein (cupin superfamily)